jgi:hypothetical protein
MVVAASALFNTVQNFVTLSLTKRLYNNVPAAQPGLSSTGFMAAEFVLTSHPSDFVAGPYIRNLDIDFLRSTLLCRVQHPQQSV